MEKYIVTNLYSVVYMQSFAVFPEYFIAISAIYILVVSLLIIYNSYGLIIQKGLCECIALVLLMACYLMLNDDLLTNVEFLSFSHSIANDPLAFFTKFIVCVSSALFFQLLAGSLKKQRLLSFEYLLILIFAVIGLIILCSSNDLLTVYLALELTSLSSYVLASFKKTSSYSIDAGIKYFVTGAISSAFFLLGSSLIYAFSGSIFFIDLWDFLILQKDFPDIALHKLNSFEAKSLLFNFHFFEFGLTLILFSVFIKLALVPFHLWSLDVYEGSPISSTFFFAVIAKFSIFIFLLRFCYKTFLFSNESWQFYCAFIGVISVFLGSLGGLQQRRLKTLLAYSSISHMGYSILALATTTQNGVEAFFLYFIIYTISGFIIWSILLSLQIKTKRVSVKFNKELGDIALLKKSNLPLALVLTFSMFSIAGVPPLIGFFAKMNLFLTLISTKLRMFYVIALITIFCSVISTFYYIRIVKILYFENLLVGKLYYPLNWDKTLPLGSLTFLLLFLFINPTFLYLLIYNMVLNSFIYL